MVTHYDTLGVPQSADTSTIQKAFRRLCLKYHPDKNPAESAKEKFLEISEARNVLCDPNKKQLYDLELRMEASSIDASSSYNFSRSGRRNQAAAATAPSSRSTFRSSYDSSSYSSSYDSSTNHNSSYSSRYSSGYSSRSSSTDRSSHTSKKPSNSYAKREAKAQSKAYRKAQTKAKEEKEVFHHKISCVYCLKFGCTNPKCQTKMKALEVELRKKSPSTKRREIQQMKAARLAKHKSFMKFMQKYDR